MLLIHRIILRCLTGFQFAVQQSENQHDSTSQTCGRCFAAIVRTHSILKYIIITEYLFGADRILPWISLPDYKGAE